ncbi:helix-turn-helix transcriptional regulator [Staphylococcus aureus]
MSRQTASRWEQGKTLPNIYVLNKLSELFDISYCLNAIFQRGV